jgi:hypothetical protein
VSAVATAPSTVTAPSWVVRGAYCTDGERLFVVAHRGTHRIELEDAALPVGDLQPPIYADPSAFLRGATYRHVPLEGEHA